MSEPPPLRPDWALLSTTCGNCGRDVNDPRAHWHDLCHPWAARLTIGAFVLVEVALLAQLVWVLLR